MTMLLIAAICFVGTHFILSHPLRAPLVAAIGERGFAVLYSIVAIVTFAWMVMSYRTALIEPPMWSIGNLAWAIVTALMLVASVLLAGSLIRNPAFPTLGVAETQPGRPQGVYAITRHPMMWSFAIWGVAHAIVLPVTKNFILTAAVVILALVGATLQDAKKERLQPGIWPAWERQTSFVPFAAVITGRAQIRSLSAFTLIAGTLFWLAATWAHLPLAGWAAGIWRWL